MDFPTRPLPFPEFRRDHAAQDSPLGLPHPRRVVGPVFFDTETSALHPDDGARVSVVSVAFHVEGDPLPWSAAWAFGQGPDPDTKFTTRTDYPTEPEYHTKYDIGRRAWNHLLRWLNSAGGGLVGHNAKFDILQLAGRSVAGYPGRDLTDRLLYDTMIIAPEVWPRGPLALKELGKRLYGQDADEEKRALKPYLGPQRDPRYDLVPWPVMFPYAIRDAELTLAVYEEQWSIIDEANGLSKYLPMEMDISRALCRMELAGLPYDADASLEYADQIDRTMDQLQATLPFEIRPKMLKQYFFGEGEHDLGMGRLVPCLNLTPYETTPTGQPKMTAPVVERMVRDGVPHAAQLQEYNRLKSANSKWYRPFAERAGADGRIRTSFRHVGGTKSGRFSASRINLQAVPKDYALHLPVPTPRQVVSQAVHHLPADWGLFDLDLEQAELRVAALYAGCDTMLDHIREGRDAHGETATELFGVHPGDDDWGMLRTVAKRANFSLIFGSGPQTFKEMLANQAGLDMPLREVQRIVYDWRDLYPEFGQAIDQSMDICERQGYVSGLLGRRRYYSPEEDAHSAFNQVVQSSLATYAKMWTISTDRLCRELDLRRRGIREGVGSGGLLLIVHDSQVLLLPNADGEGESIVQTICDNASHLWDQAFPGVPGGADWERWA